MSLIVPPPPPNHPVRMAFNRKPSPRDGLIAHLHYFKESIESPEFWTVRLYRDNFDSFTAEDRMVIFNWVSDIIKDMRVFEPRSYVEVYERAPV